MKPFRAAIYARFSSDLQRDRSIDDQIAVCRDYAARQGYSVVATFSDHAVTGATRHGRAGIQRLLDAAAAGTFDLMITETMSRVGRDEEDRAAIRKRLTFHGVTIMTPVDGVVTRLTDGIKAVIDSHYLEDLKVMIRRGMAGVIRDGRHAGGRAYGYRPIPGQRGELEIVLEQADIVRRIFRAYVDGDTERSIAATLNAEGVPPPRKSHWRASTLHGHAQRKTGILRNELYCGRLIWNRTYFVRDPDTGKRLSRHNPPSEWQCSDVPRLRIIDDDLFDQAQRVRASRAHLQGRAAARPKRILSGLLRCGACGAGMSKKDTSAKRPRIVCTRMHDAGMCSNRRSYYLDDIERLVVGGLRDELGTLEAINYFVRCYNNERRRVSTDSGDRRRELDTEIANIDRQIERAVTAIIQGRITEAEAASHLPGLRERRAQIADELAALGSRPVILALRPAIVESYLRDLARLEEVINSDITAGDEGAARTIRAMIETVTVMPSLAGQQPGIIVRGELGSLLGLDPFQKGPQLGGKVGSGGRI
jgi:site-specific DNA recombinase